MSQEIYVQSQLSCQRSTTALEEVISSILSKLLRYTTSATYVCHLQQEVPSICYHKKYKAI